MTILENANISFMGDPHLGRKFTSGVPPIRRGERENFVHNEFRNQLLKPKSGTKLHICVGDLFDKFRVPEEIILFAFFSYKEAAERNPNIKYVVLRGNHDASRDTELVSSFELFEQLCRGIPNVSVVSEFPEWFTVDDTEVLICPWHPYKTAEEIVDCGLHLTKEKKQDYIAVGHWDIKDFGLISGESNTNMIPYELLKDAKLIVSGHYHNKTEFESEFKTPVIITGSLQPYSHSEDSEELWYVTRTKDQVLDQLDKKPDTYHLKNLRVMLTQGDVFDTEVDCLSLTVGKIKTEQQQVDLNIDIDGFDLKSIFFQTLTENGVSQELTSNLWETTQGATE
jgi:DNA repair exonuclease SbcCD nuclease subunit